MNPAEPFKDPVCGMTVKPQSPHRSEFEGRPVYFCCGGCKAKFDADPHKYMHPAPVVAAERAPAAVAPAGTVYTCPMHPEIRQDHPGTCPKCGMALEPEMPSLEEDENPELIDFRRRFWWTLPLTVVVIVLAMFGHRLRGSGHGDAELGRARAVAAGRAVGRLAVLRARRAVGRAIAAPTCGR